MPRRKKDDGFGMIVKVDKFLSSPDFIAMTPAQRGVYFSLLLVAWKSDDCTIPADIGELKRMCNGGRTFTKDWEVVQRKWVLKGDRYYNEVQIEVWEKAQQWKAKSSIGGKKSAAKRGKGGTPNGGTKDTPKLPPKRQPKPNNRKSNSNNNCVSETETQPESVGFILKGSTWNAEYKAIPEPCRMLFDDWDEWADYYTTIWALIAENDGGQFLFHTIEYIEKCQNPRRDELGELEAPGAYFLSQCFDWLDARLIPYPGKETRRKNKEEVE